MRMDEIFNNDLLSIDLTANYIFQKNYLGSMLKLKGKTIKQLSIYLISNNVKGGVSLVNKINKGILPKKIKTRKLISEFLEMEQKDIFINIEKLEESKKEYLESNSRKLKNT